MTPLAPSPARPPVRGSDPAIYAARRARILERLAEEDAALILHGGQLRTRSNDTEFRFRPDSDFHYLCGLVEPGAVMVLRPGHEPAFALFVRARDREAEVWSGRRVGPEGAVEHYGADAAWPLAQLETRLPSLLDGLRKIYGSWESSPGLQRRVRQASSKLMRRNRWGSCGPMSFGELPPLMGEERIIKDPAALSSLRKAVDISAQGHLAGMRELSPDMHEYELEARIEYEFRRLGSSGPGYTSIVGGGDNANILHYVDNEDPLRAGDLVLVDAGAEWDYFTGDITRTYPVGARFSGPQAELYEVVLEANKQGIAQCTRGGDIEAVHELCLKILSQGMVDLGLLQASVDNVLNDKLYERYYMHRTSHWLGVDVHDVGLYTLSGEVRKLAPGQVLTVEPGLYVAADDPQAPEAYRGTGIRIEDDVLITAQGPEVLSHAVPKERADIESLRTPA